MAIGTIVGATAKKRFVEIGLISSSTKVVNADWSFCANEGVDLPAPLVFGLESWVPPGTAAGAGEG
jgi:hypothetical protein